MVNVPPYYHFLLMSNELRKDTIAELFKHLLQHIRSMQTRLEYAKAATSKKQKYAINNALIKTKSAVDSICDLLGDTAMVVKVKNELDKADLTYVMLLTEQLLSLSHEELEEITDGIENYINTKNGTAESG